MPDETSYVGTLLEINEALEVLPGLEAQIAEVAYKLWKYTMQVEEEARKEADARGEGHSGPAS